MGALSAWPLAFPYNYFCKHMVYKTHCVVDAAISPGQKTLMIFCLLFQFQIWGFWRPMYSHILMLSYSVTCYCLQPLYQTNLHNVNILTIPILMTHFRKHVIYSVPSTLGPIPHLYTDRECCVFSLCSLPIHKAHFPNNFLLIALDLFAVICWHTDLTRKKTAIFDLRCTFVEM